MSRPENENENEDVWLASADKLFEIKHWEMIDQALNEIPDSLCPDRVLLTETIYRVMVMIGRFRAWKDTNGEVRYVVLRSSVTQHNTTQL
jgi:hypothetical protein